MRLLQDLRREHDLIDPVVGAMQSFVAALCDARANPRDAERFLAFFRLFAGAFHHAREESVLFRALVEELGLPRDRGPIGNLSGDHRTLESLLQELEALFRRGADSTDGAAALTSAVTRYARTLRLHIDVENSVLFREAEDRLRRAGVFELSSREPTSEEEHARRLGQALLEKYPPLQDRDLIRGEECVICPHFGDTCEGIEREWWGEAEWEEFRDHVG